MPWVKLDENFPDHRKLAELGDLAPLAGWLFICGLASATANSRTGGFQAGRAPTDDLLRLGARHARH